MIRRLEEADAGSVFKPRQSQLHAETRESHILRCVGAWATRLFEMHFSRVYFVSPRVRGNPKRRDIPEGRRGSIPACAGEPIVDALPRDLLRVYPRVCGGTYSSSRIFNLVEGLSPRVRGNPFTPISSPCMTGSIPACAGEPWIS